MKPSEIGAAFALFTLIVSIVLVLSAWVLQISFNGGIVPFSHALGFQSVKEVSFGTMFYTTLFTYLGATLLRSKATIGG